MCALEISNPILNTDGNSHQASIRIALEFLKAQEALPAPLLSVHKVSFEFGVADQTLRDSIVREGVSSCCGPPTML